MQSIPRNTKIIVLSTASLLLFASGAAAFYVAKNSNTAGVNQPSSDRTTDDNGATEPKNSSSGKASRPSENKAKNADKNIASKKSSERSTTKKSQKPSPSNEKPTNSTTPYSSNSPKNTRKPTTRPPDPSPNQSPSPTNPGATPKPPTLSSYDSSVLADSPSHFYTLSDGGQNASNSAGGGNARFVNSPSKTRLPNGDIASVFNGSNQYVEVPDSNSLSVTDTGALTVEAWIRPDTLQFSRQEGTGYVHWLGKGASGQHEYAARMYSYNNSENRPNRISAYAFNRSGGLGAGSYFQNNVVVGQWIHVTMVINAKATSGKYPSGYTKIYQNGTLRDQDSLSQYSIRPENGSAPLRIGTRDFNSFFKGGIGKVAVYNYELSQNAIATHYQKMR